MDGGSGILDNAREIKMRVKAFSYAYRMSNDTRWVDRLWGELQVSFFHRSIFVDVYLIPLFMTRMPLGTVLLHLVLTPTNGTLVTS